MTDVTAIHQDVKGHAFRGLPLADGCVCGWSGDRWVDHILELFLDSPLESVSVED